MELDVRLPVIGLVHTAHTELATTPIQAGLKRGEQGIIEIADRYREGLDGLAEFDYAWLHKLAEPGSEPSLRQVPFLLRSQQRSMGMFAARGPRRINPIGLSLIRILDVTGPAIRFAGVDLLDETPVLDLKPYVTRFDRPAGEPRCGWYDQVPISDGATPAQLPPPGQRPDRWRRPSVAGGEDYLGRFDHRRDLTTSGEAEVTDCFHSDRCDQARR